MTDPSTDPAAGYETDPEEGPDPQPGDHGTCAATAASSLLRRAAQALHVPPGAQTYHPTPQERWTASGNATDGADAYDLLYSDWPVPPTAQLFTLERDQDVTGLSGTGTVADGVLWPDGTVTVRWRGQRPSTVNWNNRADLEVINGHGGLTRIVFADRQPEREAVADWLDAEADCHDACYATAGGLRDLLATATGEDHDIHVAGSTLDQALALARLILGETP